MNRVTLDEARDIVISAMYEYIYDNADDDYLSAAAIKTISRSQFSTAFVRRVLDSLRLAGHIEVFSDPVELTPMFTLTSSGWNHAETIPAHHELLEISEIHVSDPVTLVPASDRIVNLDHNNPDLREMKAGLGELAADLRKSNDVGQMSAEEVTVALKEVEDLSSDLDRSNVRVPAYVERAKSALIWISSKAGESAIGIASTAVLALILSYFGVSL